MRSIYIQRSFGMTQDDLREMFKQFGTVTAVHMNDSGFAFVNFEEPEAVTASVQASAEGQLLWDGNKLAVEKRQAVARRTSSGACFFPRGCALPCSYLTPSCVVVTAAVRWQERPVARPWRPPRRRCAGPPLRSPCG